MEGLDRQGSPASPLSTWSGRAVASTNRSGLERMIGCGAMTGCVDPWRPRYLTKTPDVWGPGHRVTAPGLHAFLGPTPHPARRAPGTASLRARTGAAPPVGASSHAPESATRPPVRPAGRGRVSTPRGGRSSSVAAAERELSMPNKVPRRLGSGRAPPRRSSPAWASVFGAHRQRNPARAPGTSRRACSVAAPRMDPRRLGSGAAAR